MIFRTVTDADRQTWKATPLRVRGSSSSRCCGAPTVLVRSMDGGFVTPNCWKCGAKATLSESEFLSLPLLLACFDCGGPMLPARVGMDYAFACKPCDSAVKFGDVLPHYTEFSGGKLGVR